MSKSLSSIPDRRLVSIEQAAEYLGICARTVRNYVASGEISGYRLPGGRLLRVDIAEIDAALRPIPSAQATR